MDGESKEDWLDVGDERRIKENANSRATDRNGRLGGNLGCCRWDGRRRKNEYSIGCVEFEVPAKHPGGDTQ